jgi:PilZ domain
MISKFYPTPPLPEPQASLWQAFPAGYDFRMAFCADVVPALASVAPRRRQLPRYTLRSLAYVKLDQGNGGIVRDLTESGVAIQAVAPLRRGQEVTLRFDLLSPLVRVEARGYVTWADPSGASGIQFEPLPPRMRLAIRDWLFLQILSAASISGRDTMFASPDTQFMFSPEPAHPAIVMDEPAVEPQFGEERLRWGLLSLSIGSFSVVLDTLVLLCAVLLFSTSSLAIMGGMPAWPLAAALLITSSTIFVAVYSLLFSDFLCGATPGRRLAVMAASSNLESEPAPRFR